MTTDKYIKLPVWLAVILVTAILAVAGDTWRTVYTVKGDVRVLKVALAAKGIIDPQLCQVDQHTAKLCYTGSIVANTANQSNQSSKGQ